MRTPLIPGATDSDENIAAIAAYLAEVNTKNTMLYYELLNFNPLGDSKYKSMRRKNPFEGVKPLPTARVKELQSIAQQAGITVRVE